MRAPKRMPVGRAGRRMLRPNWTPTIASWVNADLGKRRYNGVLAVSGNVEGAASASSPACSLPARPCALFNPMMAETSDSGGILLRIVCRIRFARHKYQLALRDGSGAPSCLCSAMPPMRRRPVQARLPDHRRGTGRWPKDIPQNVVSVGVTIPKGTDRVRECRFADMASKRRAYVNRHLQLLATQQIRKRAYEICAQAGLHVVGDSLVPGHGKRWSIQATRSTLPTVASRVQRLSVNQRST